MAMPGTGHVLVSGWSCNQNQRQNRARVLRLNLSAPVWLEVASCRHWNMLGVGSAGGAPQSPGQSCTDSDLPMTGIFWALTLKALWQPNSRGDCHCNHSRADQL